MPEKSPQEYWKVERLARVAAVQRAHQLKKEAARIVTLWNEQLASDEPLLFSPTLGAALMGGFDLLEVLCPGCDSIATVGLRPLRDPRGVTLREIVFRLRCARCRGEAPQARPVRLMKGLG